MRKYIFDCLYDKQTSPNAKLQCLELTQFLISDSNFLQYCYDHKIEKILVDILKKEQDEDEVISSVLRTFIILHASSIFNDSNIIVGKELKKNNGVEHVLTIFDDRINRESIKSWEFIKRIVQTIFMLNFDK